MKLFTKIIYPATLALALGTTLPSAAQSVLDVSNSSLEPSVILPESCETNTKAMLEDWYLQQYVVLDYEADKRAKNDFSDEELLQRLGALPNLIEMPLNNEVRNVIRFYANRRQLVENMLGLSLYYMPIFEEALERHGLPLELKYLPVIESALVPTAVSRAGAAGLWQFMPATAKDLGLEVSSVVDQRRDPYLSSDAAARYLKSLYNTFGDWSLAIAAYNCGAGNVNKALRRAGEGKHDFWEIYPFLPKETRGYVPAFIAANYIMNYHKDHNISPALARRPLITDTVHVNRRVHFEQISEVMDIPMSELRALNPQFRQDYIPGDARPYSLVLPSLQAYAYIVNEDSILNHNAGKFARRGIVEPASAGSTGRDARGEYYDEEVTKYHTVRKGETLTSIAKKYGVTVASIRTANGLGKKTKTVKVGRKLKIKTVQRRYKPQVETAPKPEEVKTDVPEAGVPVTLPDSIPVPDGDETISAPDTTASGSVSAAFEAPKEPEKPAAVQEQAPPAVQETPKADPQPKPKPATQQQAKPKTYTVVKGDNLGKIAKRYNTTVAALKKANKLKDDRINIGQKLVIP